MRFKFLFILFFSFFFFSFQKAHALRFKTIYDLGAQRGTSIVIEKDKLFVFTPGVLKKIDLASGRVLWQRVAPLSSGNLVKGGQRLFIALPDGWLLAYGSEDGHFYWQKSWPFSFSVQTLSAFSDRVLISSTDNKLLCLDANKGKLLWHYQGTFLSDQSFFAFVDMPLKRLSLRAEDKSILFSDPSGKITLLAGSDGRVKWESDVSLPDPNTLSVNLIKLASTPLIIPHYNMVVTISRVGQMVATDLKSGKNIWRFGTMGLQTPLLYDHTLYVITTQGKLIALEARSGKKKWASSIEEGVPANKWGDGFWYGPVLLPGKRPLLLAASTTGTLATFDLHNQGKVKAVYDIRYGALDKPIVVDENIYVKIRNGSLLVVKNT